MVSCLVSQGQGMQNNGAPEYSQNSGMCSDLSCWPSVHLGVIQVGIHHGIIVQEPDINPIGDPSGVFWIAIDSPWNGIVENGVAHIAKIPDVVDEGSNVWIELTISGDVCTCYPDYARDASIEPNGMGETGKVREYVSSGVENT